MNRISSSIQLVNGVFSTQKPKGQYSTYVVNSIKRILAQHYNVNVNLAKVGHGGTLDPFATGVLVVGVGKGCKELTNYLHCGKEYIVTGKFGVETDTMDLDGKEVRKADFMHITNEKLNNILKEFTGEIQQIPPSFSAKKVQGVRAYNLARNGTEVILQPNTIHIHKIECLKLDLPFFVLKVNCGAGAYMRALVHHIAIKLGSVAHATDLQRTKQGVFTLQDSLLEHDWKPETILEAMKNSVSLLSKIST